MSTWYLNKNGISLNEGGRWITFSFIKLANNKKRIRGGWLFRIWIRPPSSKRSLSFEAFIYIHNVFYE